MTDLRPSDVYQGDGHTDYSWYRVTDAAQDLHRVVRIINDEQYGNGWRLETFVDDPHGNRLDGTDCETAITGAAAADFINGRNDVFAFADALIAVRQIQGRFAQ